MTILQALAGQYDRLANTEDPAKRPPRYGYSLEKISYVLVLSAEGVLLEVQSLMNTSGRKPKPSSKSVPQSVVRSSGIVSNFLWDKTAYVLGARRDRDTDKIIETPKEFHCFRKLNGDLLSGTDDEGLLVFLRFLENWRPDRFTELPGADEVLDTNVVFRLGSELQFLHERPAADKIWLNHLTSSIMTAISKQQCLVSGELHVPKRLHEKIKGVGRAQSSGASIVSFNLDAFTSYGKVQGENAPVSYQAAFAYTTALNHMLVSDSGYSVQIGDTTTVFWAESGSDMTKAALAEDLFSMILQPTVSDDTETVKLSETLESIAAGRPLSDMNPKLSENTRFFILGLAPNASRLSIRFWMEDSFGKLVKRVAQHFIDIQIEPVPWKVPPAPWRLLLETAAQRKRDNIQPTLNGSLMRSILTGSRYPQSLFGAVIARIRADNEINGIRAAICKAILNRNSRLQNKREDIPVSLNTEEVNAAYRLGRMFALYERVQQAALGGDLNVTIRDRYFGAASATPASVFPILARNATHHLSSIRKRGDKDKGLAIWFERQIESILEGMSSAFPKSLRLEEQGRFAIGYYHQKSSNRKTATDFGKSSSDESDALNEEN